MSSTNVATLTPKKNNLIGKFADKFNVDEKKVMDILKSTAFKQRDGKPPSDDQMMALLIVADQYGLNPFVKEIYAYPDKSNGIVPVVGVDGWSRIMNDHSQMDGIEFNYSPETSQHKGKLVHDWIECVITRKDRSKPIVVREYFDEVVRSASFPTPWDTHPKRMHRHKAEIQCARIAFGFAGIYDEDEAERILEKDVTSEGQTISNEPQQTPVLTNEVFNTIADKYKEGIRAGKKSVNDFIAWVENKGALMTDAQKSEVASWAEVITPATVENETGNVDADFTAAYENAESENK
jgi:phage recombination protein Bet